MGSWRLLCPTEGEFQGECRYEKRVDGTFILKCKKLKTIKKCKNVKVEENMTEEKNDDLVGYILAGVLGATAVAGIVLTFVPEARDGLARMLGMAPKDNPKKGNPHPEIVKEIVKVEPQPQKPKPHFRTPRYGLRPKYAHSATDGDIESLETKAQRENFLVGTPTAEILPAKKVESFKPRGRLRYGGGGGRAYSKEELERIDRRA